VGDGEGRRKECGGESRKGRSCASEWCGWGGRGPAFRHGGQAESRAYNCGRGENEEEKSGGELVRGGEDWVG